MFRGHSCYSLLHSIPSCRDHIRSAPLHVSRNWLPGLDIACISSAEQHWFPHPLTPPLLPAAMTNLCRDEVTAVLKDQIEAVFGSSFNTNGLGAVLTCGVTGIGAGLSHSPICSVSQSRCSVCSNHACLHAIMCVESAQRHAQIACLHCACIWQVQHHPCPGLTCAASNACGTHAGEMSSVSALLPAPQHMHPPDHTAYLLCPSG
jgi:hypothetical protein